MKTAWLILSRSFLAFLTFIVLYLVFAFILTWIPVTPKKFAGKKDKTIYLFSNGVHLDIVIPAEDFPLGLKTKVLHNLSAKLLGIGWGDKGFYLDTPTWADLSASVAIKAMFLPSPTAMHVTEHTAISEKWSVATVSQEQLDALFDYITSTFKIDASGNARELKGEGYTARDRFYEAHGNYSCFKTCNTWVNTGMKRIGVETAIWTPMDKGVLRYLDSTGSDM